MEKRKAASDSAIDWQDWSKLHSPSRAVSAALRQKYYVGYDVSIAPGCDTQNSYLTLAVYDKQQGTEHLRRSRK